MKQLFEAYKPEELVLTRRIINTPSDFARKCLFYVQETGYLKCLKSHLSQRTNLNSYLFFIVLSGRGVVTYKEQEYILNSGDCILINCMEHYTHQSDLSSPWELLWVHFNGIAAEEYYKYFISTFNYVWHAERSETYAAIIYELIDVHQKKEASWELLSSKLITDLLTNCMIRKNPEQSPDSDAITYKLYQVKEYLEQNYTEKIQLDILAETFYISKFHLCREYKKLFGTTIIDYVTMKRITSAKELLRFSKMSIEDIAVNSGYPDASYFNKVFQKMEGMTASEFRRKW
jgi:AraC-like DNA-binding protein